MANIDNATSDEEIIQGAAAPVRTGVTLTGTAIEAAAMMHVQKANQDAQEERRGTEQLLRQREALRAADTSQVETTIANLMPEHIPADDPKFTMKFTTVEWDREAKIISDNLDKLNIPYSMADGEGEEVDFTFPQSCRPAVRKFIDAYDEKVERFSTDRVLNYDELASELPVSANTQRWIDHATPEKIADMVQITDAWSGEDERLSDARTQIVQDVQDRYHVDVTAYPDRDSLIAALNGTDGLDGKAARREDQAEEQRDEASRHLADADAADAALDGQDAETAQDADRTEQAENVQATSEEQAAAAFDSADRLDGEADRMRADGVSEEQVEGRMLVEVSHGKPANQAPVAGAAAGRRSVPKKARSKAVRKGRATARQQGLTR